MRALLLVAAALAFTPAFAANAPPSQRFLLSGTGSLHGDPPIQAHGNFRLDATLLPVDAAITAAPPVQEDARFALMASVSASSLVCYNDTIFRDDFDGDGF